MLVGSGQATPGTLASSWLDSRLKPAMYALGATAAGKVVQELDTPYPPASQPGTPPHKRTGNLQAGVDHQEGQNGDALTTTITSNRAEGDPLVPLYLENGTQKMAARPYMRPVMNQAETIVPDAMRKGLGGGT